MWMASSFTREKSAHMLTVGLFPCRDCLHNMMSVHSFSDDAAGPLVSFLARLAVRVFLGLGTALPALPEANATDPGARSDSPSVVEPRRYRGPYVPPGGHGAEPDPFAPGPDSPYWVRLEMTSPEGRKTFPPRIVEVASELRYEQRNRALGLDLGIDLDMHPQPFMTVNEKIYPVEFDLSGWRLVAHVTADVGSREFENAWFAAFADQSALVSGLPPTSAVPGSSAAFRVDEATFGPVQKTVVHDDGRTTSRVGYAGRLTLRETLGSFVARQWGLARQESFVLAYGALIGIVLSLLGNVVAIRLAWLRGRRRHTSVAVPSTNAPVPRPRPGLRSQEAQEATVGIYARSAERGQRKPCQTARQRRRKFTILALCAM